MENKIIETLEELVGMYRNENISGEEVVTGIEQIIEEYKLTH